MRTRQPLPQSAYFTGSLAQPNGPVSRCGAKRSTAEKDSAQHRITADRLLSDFHGDVPLRVPNQINAIGEIAYGSGIEHRPAIRRPESARFRFDLVRSQSRK